MSHESRVFGHIPGILPGATFSKRAELVKAGVHALNQAGIHGDPVEGAYSICLSGGYEDNQDSGDKIIYVGSGGQDSLGQYKNQSFDDGPNKSLLVSSQTRRPVRVVRGKSKTDYWAPAKGYRYDGLYVVHSAEMRPGKKGFQMCFFELRRIREEGDSPLPTRRTLTIKKLNNMLRRAPR